MPLSASDLQLSGTELTSHIWELVRKCPIPEIQRGIGHFGV